MAQTGRTFRIFVSSTFSDLKEERNALQKEVFSRLRNLCQQHGCRFQAIDLRWGVADEAALDQQTMKICLGEIAHCKRLTPRPNFVVLLGDRYGWQPLPAEIAASTFEKILDQVFPAERERLLWSESQPTDSKGWYRWDGNAEPPVYCLQPRQGADVDSDVWATVERELREILLKAAARAPAEHFAERLDILSATEQEITCGVGEGPGTQSHAFGFFRTIKNLTLNRSTEGFVDLDQNGNPDLAASARLAELKKRLRASLSGNIFEYEVDWSGTGVATANHLQQLCADAWRCLSRVILDEIRRLKEVDSLEREIHSHEIFGQERAEFFTGRRRSLEALADYVGGTSPHPFLISGESGCGKTALMAQGIADCGRDAPNRMRGCVIVSRFLGATPASSDCRALLESLCSEISRRYGVADTGIPTQYEKLVEELPQRLSLARADKPLIVFLDALDQLSGSVQRGNIAWLPLYLPANVRLVVSTVPGEFLTLLTPSLPASNRLLLEPMPRQEGSTLLDLWLGKAGRKLQDYQRAEVLDRFAENGLPLYLKLAFETSLQWKSYTKPADVRVGRDISSTIRALFARLSSEADHGPTLVSRSLGYLAASRKGLSEDELLDILSNDTEVMSDFQRRSTRSPRLERLPVVVWSRLYFALQPYLAHRNIDGTSLITFYHGELGKVAEKCFVEGDTKTSLHDKLARYFKTVPMPRRLSEWPYQLREAKNWDALKEALSGLDLLDSALADGFGQEWASYWRVLEGQADPLLSYSASLERLRQQEGESARLAAMMVKVAGLFSAMAQQAAALNLLEKALPISERANGRFHYATAEVINQLGMICISLARYREAQSYYKRLVEIDAVRPMTEDREKAAHLGNLAEALRALGKYDEALDLHGRALEIAQHDVGPNYHARTAHLNGMARTLHKMGRYPDAEQHYGRALQIIEKADPGGSEVAMVLNNLAMVQVAQGRYSSALSQLERALEIDMQVFGPNHPKVAVRLSNLATCYGDLGQQAQAERNMEAALQIMERINPGHPETATMMTNLGILYQKQKKYVEAQNLLERALEIDRKVYPIDHAELATDLNNLGGVYENMKDSDRALSCYQEALRILEKTGPASVDMARVLNNLGRCRLRRGDHEGAFALYQRSLQIKEKVLGSGHPSIATTYMNVAYLFTLQRNTVAAESWLQRAVAILENCFGNDHPQTREARDSLKACQDLRRREQES